MEFSDSHAVIAYVVQQRGGFDRIKGLQKTLYFMDQFHIPTWLTFQISHHGSFSRKLDYQLDDLAFHGVISLSLYNSPDVGFVKSVKPGYATNEIVQTKQLFLQPYQSRMNWLLELLPTDATALELMSIIDFHIRSYQRLQTSVSAEWIVHEVMEFLGGRYSVETVWQYYQKLIDDQLISLQPNQKVTV